jgi:formylglycine-generating enzyme required for sulfatase activity
MKNVNFRRQFLPPNRRPNHRVKKFSYRDRGLSVKRGLLLLLCFLGVACLPSLSDGKELPRMAVWDLEPRNTPETHARELTSFVVSEITKLKKYEVYSQENVRTLAGWSAERMKLGCTDAKCLTALGQMDIAKLISGSVGKIGKRYTVSLNLFNTQNARVENALSKTCESEDELIELIQASVRELLRESPATPAPGEYRDPTTGMELVLIKGGCYQMGDGFGDGYPNEKPVYDVCVGDFYMGKHEVTQRQWQAIMGSNPSCSENCGDDCPVECVSWNDAQDFISRLNQRTGRKFRLPTEAEWEYAARSGGKREKWAGTSNESDLGDYAWVQDNSQGTTHSVGQKKPNGLGFFDMTGNVWEWCQDWYDENYYQRRPRDNPGGPASGGHRVLRGGSWLTLARNARATYRYGLDPGDRYDFGGFRLVLVPR